MAWNDRLDGPALDFAASATRLIRALAGPGTGKTYALIRRLLRLVETNECEPERILVVTFARTAAVDIVNKILQEDERIARVDARTLHSFCFSILTSQGFLNAMDRRPRLLMDFERDYLLRDLQGDFGTLTDRRKLTNAFVAAWARLPTERPGQPVIGLDQDFQNALLATLRWHGAMLIGEVVPLALAYLRQDVDAPARTTYRHVLVDEYQDLNRAEQVLVDLIAGPRNLAIIGDDDQSIYRTMKHAHPDGIRTFSADHPGTQDVALTECRRCPPIVVELTQTLIERNQGRIRGPLMPFPGNPPGEVHNVQWASLEEETEGIAEFLSLQIAAGVDVGQCLVLAPAREIGYAIRDAGLQRGIDIRSSFREEALDSLAARETLTLLTLLANPNDRPALRAWTGLGSQSGRVGGYRAVRTRAQADNTDVVSVLNRIEAGDIQVPRSASAVERWRALRARVDELQPLLRDLPRLIDTLMPAQQEEDESELLILRKAALDVLAEVPQPPLRELPERIRYRVAQPEIPLETTYARVMSLQKSKGLSAGLVVIAGLVDGLLPRVDREADAEEQQAQLEEQRRLFYVGMTRSTQTLVLSRSSTLPDAFCYSRRLRTAGRRGNAFRVFPSRFLEDTGPRLPAAVAGRQWIQLFRR